MNKFFLSIGVLLAICNYNGFAQSYTKDSLQFKVYTIATFKDSRVRSIKLNRVFCDYCSKEQTTALGQTGLKLSNNLVKKPKNRLVNGEKRLTIVIRVKREDFYNINKKDSID
ncbi:hypothetical protein L3X37_12250 [Sabulilitoribacter arenilitoris]|uniref:Uncharacterized protein n=1 Tax=Wocania arenilitoris TaxID=2044858 RepID=A0AAE3ES71_9FLAO|nr:hypothetical protein [Wocania arenilitoris]MCF7569130.1 hypothetical protein [Wocania arenilitoris]